MGELAMGGLLVILGYMFLNPSQENVLRYHRHRTQVEYVGRKSPVEDKAPGAEEVQEVWGNPADTAKEGAEEAGVRKIQEDAKWES